MFKILDEENLVLIFYFLYPIHISLRNSKKVEISCLYVCLSVCKFLTRSLSGHYLARYNTGEEEYVQWPQSSLAYLAAHYCGHMHRELFILAMSVVLYYPKVFPKTIFFCLGLKMCDKWKILPCACFQVSML